MTTHVLAAVVNPHICIFQQGMALHQILSIYEAKTEQVGPNMHDFDHELNWVIKWAIKGINFYGNLVNASSKFSFEYLFQISPFRIAH